MSIEWKKGSGWATVPVKVLVEMTYAGGVWMFILRMPSIGISWGGDLEQFDSEADAMAGAEAYLRRMEGK